MITRDQNPIEFSKSLQVPNLRGSEPKSAGKMLSSNHLGGYKMLRKSFNHPEIENQEDFMEEENLNSKGKPFTQNFR